MVLRPLWKPTCQELRTECSSSYHGTGQWYYVLCGNPPASSSEPNVSQATMALVSGTTSFVETHLPAAQNRMFLKPPWHWSVVLRPLWKPTYQELRTECSSSHHGTGQLVMSLSRTFPIVEVSVFVWYLTMSAGSFPLFRKRITYVGHQLDSHLLLWILNRTDDSFIDRYLWTSGAAALS